MVGSNWYFFGCLRCRSCCCLRFRNNKTRILLDYILVVFLSPKPIFSLFSHLCILLLFSSFLHTHRGVIFTGLEMYCLTDRVCECRLSGLRHDERWGRRRSGRQNCPPVFVYDRQCGNYGGRHYPHFQTMVYHRFARDQ